MSVQSQKILLAIPMKDPREAKSRLCLALTSRQRAELAILLFLDVVACAKVATERLPQRSIDIAVISSSPTIKTLADAQGLKWIDDTGAKGLNASLELAASMASEDGYDFLCILPGDLADPKPCDLAQLLDYPSHSKDAVICPSVDLGTNALLVPLPCPIAFAYGEKSFHHHYRACIDAELLTVVLPLSSLRRDVDTLIDLHYLQSLRPGERFWSEA
ncbi:2-phospho-L-lactate guanylyltransferase [uncultured Cohaesibacter sp.]|uniref:2-phospho-L-lactate guanylyltransferase n=1 Tax=uncultured Cohaesibacter sp. TaxID=1002546 RepID=UPI00292F0C9D|nr:2-phospho-L-lactate guanylyltransferase [uncultured Cohaesibacter sp.]